jgi:hypothetical protein
MPGRSWLTMIGGMVATAMLELIVWLCIIGAVLVLWTSVASAQTPDGRGEIHLDEPVYQGERASAPAPPGLHVRNEGGSDTKGLCVVASILANGMYQGVPGLNEPGRGTSNVKGLYEVIPNAPGKGSTLWRTAKSRPGGYYPEKLQALVKEVMPNEGWATYYGADERKLDALSRQGVPIGATMGTGANYRYMPISHMVSLLHYRTGGNACVLDNNFPGEFTWMPASEFARRWKRGGEGWAWVWTRRPLLAPGSSGSLLVLLAAVGSALLILFGRR